MGRAALAAVLVAAAVATAHAASFVVTSQRLDLDAQRGVLRAWGVRITDGLRVVMAPWLVLERQAGLGVLEGGVQARGPEGELRGQVVRIRFTPALEFTRFEATGSPRLVSEGRVLSSSRLTLDPRSGVATAEGAPRLVVPPDLRATGGRIVYRSRERTAHVASPARFENREGALQGRDAEFDLKSQTARLEGPVSFRFPAGRGVAQAAVADFGQGRVVLAGPVRMRWRSSVLEAERVTVWYRQGRVVVEGASRIRVEEEDLPQRP